MFIGRLEVTAVEVAWVPIAAGFWVDRGFDKIMLFPEFDITGPGSDALGVRPETMLLPTEIPLVSLFGTLSAIIAMVTAASEMKI